MSTEPINREDLFQPQPRQDVQLCVHPDFEAKAREIAEDIIARRKMEVRGEIQVIDLDDLQAREIAA